MRSTGGTHGAAAMERNHDTGRIQPAQIRDVRADAHARPDLATAMRSNTRMSRSQPPAKPQLLHPRNRHQGHYDFKRLTRVSPALKPYLVRTPAGETSIDFANPRAVRTLNQALLKADYGVAHWEIPESYLCPPVPGRADYIHGLADLLAGDRGGEIPQGASVRVFDLGTGANAVYPLIGRAEYGWRFTGSDIDPTALRIADAIVRGNALTDAIELRAQTLRGHLFHGVMRPDERFDATLCNPPFHASAAEASRSGRIKRSNLAAHSDGPPRASRKLPLNFGGRDGELWCQGGEARFVRKMIRESVDFSRQVLWFSSLVSKSVHLPGLRAELRKAGAGEIREVAMAQGNKQSRFLAWSFHNAEARREWWAGRPQTHVPPTPERGDS